VKDEKVGESMMMAYEIFYFYFFPTVVCCMVWLGIFFSFFFFFSPFLFSSSLPRGALVGVQGKLAVGLSMAFISCRAVAGCVWLRLCGYGAGIYTGN
jgi:hypothetical protein